MPSLFTRTLLAVVLLGHADALAEPQPPTTSTLSPVRDGPGSDDPNTKDQETLGEVVIGGRVFARAAFVSREQSLVAPTGMVEDRQVRSLDLTLPSARLKAEYQSSVEWLSAEIEAEFSGRAELKDGYVQLRSKPFWLRAGQFKMPFSAFAMESPWRLPMVHRGFTHDMVSDVLQVGGRAPGLSARVRAKGGLRPELNLGAFQGSILTDPTTNDTDPAEERFVPSQHGVARVGFRLGDVEVGANYQHRMGANSTTFEQDYHWTIGADAVLDVTFPRGGLRAWVEGIAGESWLEHIDKPEDEQLATFLLARVIVAPRFLGTIPDEFYVEPFAMFSLLEPDSGGVVDDIAWEASLGVNTGLWEKLRLALQGEIVRTQPNFPSSYVPNRNPDRIALLAQLGVSF